MMKELEINFIGRGEVRGFVFTQLLKSDKGYLYEVKTPNSDIHYEVFERRINKRYNTVTYPKSPAFSRYAYAMFTYEDAVKKFNEL